MHKKIWLFSFIFVFIDQLTKVLISNLISLNSEIRVIPSFFYLANVHNDGAAFSILRGNLVFLIIMTIISIFLIYYFFIKGKKLTTLESFLLSMLLGGIIGNFIDRVIYGYVIDYLGFIIFGYYFPIFNLADSFIIISIAILLIFSFKEELWKNIKLNKKTDD